jgi:hypothetical protein
LSPLTKKVALALYRASSARIPGVKVLGPSSKVRATVPGTEQLQMIEPGGG